MTAPGRALGYVDDAQWAGQLVDPLPAAWADRLIGKWSTSGKGRQGRNLELLKSCGALRAAAFAGIAPDAQDSTIRQEAEESARDMVRRLALVVQIARGERKGEQIELCAQVLEAQWWLSERGLLAYWPAARGMTIDGALRRVQCARWWRRVLRRVHAAAVEGTARSIGLVHKRAGCYASDDAVRRRAGQVERNAKSLESVRAINEHGQDFSLAELASKGTSNKSIRRNELMTRIAGFELIAKECGHAAAFVTVTCPSRMHAMRQGKGGRPEENPRHDGTMPDQAQRYLTRQWARFRAAADRQGMEIYGVRIAEPNHDGTPHWHAIIFFPAEVGGVDSAEKLAELLARYFLLNDSPDERGAAAHRVTVKAIDWSKGSAAGYVAKYISKNIDGHAVEKDLYGNDAATSAARVDAWASTWRIRQFQQIGGAPVTIWRELRRLHTDQAAASPTIAAMLGAVNVSKGEQHHDESVQRYTAAHGWAGYLKAQGGHRVKRRSLRVQLLKEATGEIGGYGEVMPPRAVGVVTIEQGSEWVSMPLLKRGGFTRTFSQRVEVESERSVWIVVPEASAPVVIERLRAGDSERGSAAATPWSPVNNCTGPGTRPAPSEGARMFAPLVQRHRKRGRWENWKKDDPIDQ